MAEERKRRRGHRRGRQEPPQPGRSDEKRSTPEPAGEPDVYEESEAPGVTPSRFSFRRLTSRGERLRARKESHRAGERTAGDVHPMDFWRGGAARSHRGEVVPRGIGPSGMWRRITGLYFPPWVPVVAIIAVIFGILGLLFFTRSAAGAPRIGQHWHAPYQYWVCGQRQPNFPVWEAGVHTHADGIIHIHPFTASEEGAGARLSKWFEYGGGKLDSGEVQAPGSKKAYKNGDACSDGRPGEVQVFVNGQKLPDYTRYIPKDGDQVRIVFGPSEEIIQQEDRSIIPAEQATRDVELQVSGNEGSTAFSPPSIQVDQGETVRIILKNVSEVSHGLRIAGQDGEYETRDDFLVTPDGGDPTDSSGIIDAGQQGFAVVKFDASGEVEFRDTTVQSATGKIVVRKTDTAATPSPTPEASPKDAADVELSVATGEMFYEPAALTVRAGQKFRITITNNGEFLHNTRITGPDGQFDTADDIVSPDVAKGETKDFVAQIDTPGQYQIRCDYHRTEHSGVLTVE